MGEGILVVMSWVKLRFERERRLEAETPKLWAGLCAAMEQAVEEYNELYAKAHEGTAKTNLQGNCILVFWTAFPGPLPTEQRSLKLCMDAKEKVVRKGKDAAEEARVVVLKVVSAQNTVWFTDPSEAEGNRLDEATACELILKPLLFPKG